MKSLIASIVVIGSFVNSVFSQDTIAVARTLQQNSVTVHAAGSQGSGVVIKRGNTHYILTAAHVVASLRSEQTEIEGGSKKTKIVFQDALIVTELYENNESVGQTSLKAEVIRYSNADTGEDVALLKVKKKNALGEGVEFYSEGDHPPVGTKLLHCGSLLGQVGSNSVTSGIISQVGRVLHNTIYDQSNTGAFPGSSGGGIFRESDGKYVGMLVRGAGETFNLFVPISRISTWAKRNGVEFVLWPSINIPSDEELRKFPLEEKATSSGSRSLYAPQDSYNFLIKVVDDE